MTYWTNAIYWFCFLASTASAWFLVRAWQRVRDAILYWSGACFGLLAVNNLLAIVQRAAWPDMDIIVYRALVTLTALGVFLYGFIWEDG